MFDLDKMLVMTGCSFWAESFIFIHVVNISSCVQHKTSSALRLLAKNDTGRPLPGGWPDVSLFSTDTPRLG